MPQLNISDNSTHQFPSEKEIDERYQARKLKAEIKEAVLTIILEYQLCHPQLSSLAGLIEHVCVPRNVVFEALKGRFNISEEVFEKIIGELMRQGLIYEPRANFLCRC